MELPFDGAISTFFEQDAPEAVRAAIKRAEKGDILSPTYPHSERMPSKAYKKNSPAYKSNWSNSRRGPKKQVHASQLSLKAATPQEKAAQSSASVKILILAAHALLHSPSQRKKNKPNGIFNATLIICLQAVKLSSMTAAGTIAALSNMFSASAHKIKENISSPKLPPLRRCSSMKAFTSSNFGSMSAAPNSFAAFWAAKVIRSNSGN